MKPGVLLLVLASCGTIVDLPVHLAPGTSSDPAPRAPAASTQAQEPSPPRPTKFDRSPDDLEAAVRSELAGYRRSGAPIHASLEGFAPTTVRVQRGRCYGVVARLEHGAEFGAHARMGSVAVLFRVGGEDYELGPGVVGPGAVGGGFCPQASAAATLDLQATWGRADDKTKLHDLGHGAITLQLYTRGIDDANLARRDTEAREEAAATVAAVERRHRQEAAAKDRVCTRCKAAYDECIADWRRGATKQECIREYAACGWDAAGGRYTWAYCGFPDPR